MNHYDKAKKTTLAIVIMTLIAAMLMQGCKGEITDNSSETQPSSIEYEQLKIDIDNENHCFVIKKDDSNIEMKGMILTYDHPDTANVYKIVPYDEEPEIYYNPIKEWQRVEFQPLTILNGFPVHYLDGTFGDARLSRSERKGVIDSLTRINAPDFGRMEKIKTSCPNAVFSDYVIRYTYPATDTDLYELTTFDLIRKTEVTVDFIKEKPIDYYVIRRSVGGITVGTPSNIYTHYEKYDDKKKEETLIFNEEWKFLYDGKDLYEIHTNDKATEKNIKVYQSDLPVLPVEQAFKKAAPSINRILSDSQKETWIYAAELVYLTVQLTDVSNIDYNNANYIPRSRNEGYWYPFWVIYTHSNFMSVGADEADHRPLLVNAITGEVILCN